MRHAGTDADAIRAEADVTARGIRELAQEERRQALDQAELEMRARAARGNAPAPDVFALGEQARLTVDLDRLTAEIAVLAESRQRAEIEIEEVEEQLDELQSKRRRLQTTMNREREQFRREREAVERSLAIARREAATLAAETAALVTRVREEARADVTAIEAGVATVADDAFALRTRLARLRDDLDAQARRSS